MNRFEELVAANPFPGLRSFMPGEADRFFGREEQIDALVARLDETSLVAVAGASGCGKSSLVLAGLISRLKHGIRSDGGIEWRPARLRPGNRPLFNLASGLAEALEGARTGEEGRVASLEGRLRLGGRGLAEIVRLAPLKAHSRLLVVVDQFEEIFRFRRMIDPEEAAAFVKLLLTAAREPDARVSVVLTLRSDALGLCADFPDLPETINRGQYLVPKLTRDQRKDAIVKPVQLRGFQIAPRLVQRLLNDVTSDFDDLPIMQHVLTRTWRRWAEACQGGRPIDLEDYQATGMAVRALSDHADEAFTSLLGLERTVERVFRALTERLAEGPAIRRPLNFDQVCAVVGGEKGIVTKVVERFRGNDTAFLLPSQETDLAENPVIDISHESLIRQWQRLLDWTQRELESQTELDALIGAAHRYERKEGDLLQGRDLERVREWRKRELPTAAWVGLYTGGNGDAQWQSAQAFLGMSEELAESERKHRRKVRAGTVLVSLLLAVLVASVMAGIQQIKVRSRELGSKAMLELDADPALSAHQARDAIDLDGTNGEAKHALRQSLAMLETASTEHIIPIGEAIADVRFTKDKSKLVVATDKGVRILDAHSFHSVNGLGPFPRQGGVLKAWLISENSLLVTLTSESKGQIQNVSGGPIFPLSGDSIFTLAISGDERRIATGGQRGEIRVCDVKESGVQPCLQVVSGGTDKATITALTFSPDDQYLASGDYVGVVNIWKFGAPGPWIGANKGGATSPLHHSAAIRDIAFYPDDSEVMATVSDDGTAIVWHLDLSGRRLAPNKKGEPAYDHPMDHGHPVISARFSAWNDNIQSLMTVAGKEVFFWRSITDHVTRQHDDWVNDAELSNDGKWLVSASYDGTARVWSTQDATAIAVLRGHRGPVMSASFTPDGKVLTAGQDGYLRVWHFHPQSLLASGNAWMLSAAFDPQGQRVAVTGDEQGAGQCRIIDLQGRKVPEILDPVSKKAVEFVSWSNDGEHLLGNGSSEGIDAGVVTPILWDVKSGHEITPEWLKSRLGAFFSAATDELVTIETDGSIAVWDTSALGDANPKPRFSPIHPRFRVAWAKLSPDGQWIAAIENDKVELFDATQAKTTSRLYEGHRGEIRAAEFSSDSEQLVTASFDNTARVWPIDRHADQHEFVELSGADVGALSCAAFNHDGRRVVTGGADGMIRIWDAQNGQELAALRWHDQAINEVHFGGDDQTILSASDDGTVSLGRCEACNQTVTELRKRAMDEAILPDDELREIAQEKRVRPSYLHLPALFSSNH